jgi:hypothetical protein
MAERPCTFRVAERPAWQQQAACRGAGVVVFFQPDADGHHLGSTAAADGYPGNTGAGPDELAATLADLRTGAERRRLERWTPDAVAGVRGGARVTHPRPQCPFPIGFCRGTLGGTDSCSDRRPRRGDEPTLEGPTAERGRHVLLGEEGRSSCVPSGSVVEWQVSPRAIPGG